jgi:hypothetical protein
MLPMSGLIKRTTTLLTLFALSFSANAAITLNSIGADASTNGQSIECAAPSTITDDDQLVLWAYSAGDITFTVDETGWTERVEQSSNAAGDNSHLVATKVASSESGNYTVNISGGVDRTIHCAVAAITGVDTTTSMDATPTFTTEINNDTSPTAPSITTVTDGAWVITSCGAFTTTAGTKTIPVGYTTVVVVPATNHHLGAAYKEIASAGLESPGPWDAYGTNADSTCATIALRPAGGDVTAPTLSNPLAASVGTTTVTPTVTTDEANGTMYMVVVPDADVPSVAQIKAGQQSSGGAAIASDNDAISATGAHAFAQVTGLTASTAYELYFVHTDAATNDSSASTVGFTTNAASAPTFTSAPVLDTCSATGCTFDYTADAASDTLYAMFTDTAAATPTCDAIELTTGSHGDANESTTGSADSITITSSDTPEFPIYDAHLCIEDGSATDSTVATVSNVALADPPGEQFIAITSIGSGSPCEDFNTQVAPDSASGDYLLADDATSPGSFALTVGANCHFSYAGDASRQAVLDVDVYDASAGDWHVSDIDFVANNTAPSASEDFDYPFDIDVAWSDWDICTTQFTDGDGDSMTLSKSGTEPTGLTLGGTGACTLSGDPTTENESGLAVTYTASDGFGGTDSMIVSYWPIDTITVPTLTDSDFDAAVADELTAFPWRDEATVTASYQCSGAEAAGQVLTQDPAASTEVAFDQTLSVVISSGACDVDGMPIGWEPVIDLLRDRDFRLAMRAECDGDGIWAFWKAGTRVRPRGSANCSLKWSLIRQEANGSAVWARWAPGIGRRGSADLQLDARAALAADFVVN